MVFGIARDLISRFLPRRMEYTELVYCFTLFDPLSELLAVWLQGAFAREGWFPFKRMQRSSRAASGSPFGAKLAGQGGVAALAKGTTLGGALRLALTREFDSEWVK